MKRILCVFGTRPEAIKMAPVVKSLKESPLFQVAVCVTAQHRQMLDQVLKLFEIIPEYDLNLMKPGQSLNDITASILTHMKPVLEDFSPDLVLVHGDTATTLAVSLACYYEKIDVGHVEAGLRTDNIYSPWPEELNRRLTSSIAKYHFAPTSTAQQNLTAEKVCVDDIAITGNTVIDALFSIVKRFNEDKVLSRSIQDQFDSQIFTTKIILVTGHRRENFGSGFERICQAIRILANKYPDISIVYPVHLNPNVKGPVSEILSDLKNVYLIEPLDYLPFVYLMMNSYLILTDSGGIQEEAPALGKPVVLMRDTTERPEAIEAGTVQLVGTNVKKITNTVEALLDETTAKYVEMSKKKNPYGDGDASRKIVDFLAQRIC